MNEPSVGPGSIMGSHIHEAPELEPSNRRPRTVHGGNYFGTPVSTEQRPVRPRSGSAHSGSHFQRILRINTHAAAAQGPEQEGFTFTSLLEASASLDSDQELEHPVPLPFRQQLLHQTRFNSAEDLPPAPDPLVQEVSATPALCEAFASAKNASDPRSQQVRTTEVSTSRPSPRVDLLFGSSPSPEPSPASLASPISTSQCLEPSSSAMDASSPSLRGWTHQLIAASKRPIENPQLTPLTAFIGSTIGLGGLALGEMMAAHMSDDGPLDPQLLLLGSFGALATLQFGTMAPLGAPLNIFAGHSVSLAVAYAIHYSSVGAAVWLGTSPLPAVVEKVLTPATSIALMLRLGVLHPPAAACAFIFAAMPSTSQGPQFFLCIMLGCIWMICVQLGLASVNRWYLSCSQSWPRPRLHRPRVVVSPAKNTHIARPQMTSTGTGALQHASRSMVSDCATVVNGQSVSRDGMAPDTCTSTTRRKSRASRENGERVIYQDLESTSFSNGHCSRWAATGHAAVSMEIAPRKTFEIVREMDAM